MNATSNDLGARGDIALPVNNIRSASETSEASEVFNILV